jgi:hypothetical protein
MRLPAQFAPNPCARSTTGERCRPILAVTTSDTVAGCRSFTSDTVRLIIGAFVAKRSSCGRDGNEPCSAA